MKKKGLTLLVATTMLACSAIGGTLAWLTYTTENVVNTFAPSSIKIALDETGTTQVDGVDTKNFQLIPGYSYEKDPKVTVKAGSEKCYLFVKVDDTDMPDWLDWDVREGWTALEDADAADSLATDGVYYRVVEKGTEDQPFYVLTGNTTYPNGAIVIESTIGNDDMADMYNTDGTAKAGTLTFTAYACQYMRGNDTHFEPYQAWVNAQPASYAGGVTE